ncbi:MAG TPA: hypothetical protein VLU46_04360 [Thermoanaerobaculia bacterium]|nr:hypothetical protein [Thermoanaerobaculia bacterium]
MEPRKNDDTSFEDDDDTLIDDAPGDGFELLDDDATAPEDRRRDPLRRPV